MRVGKNMRIRAVQQDLPDQRRLIFGGDRALLDRDRSRRTIR
jgi:hypothetical protein